MPPQPTADDFDGDGLPDLWELAYALNAYDPSDAAADPDGDSLTNLEEYQHATDPNTWDDATTLVSNGPPSETTSDEDLDGLPDSWEQAHGLNPNDADDIADDPDGDFILNIEEYQRGSDPQAANDFWTVMGYPIDTSLLQRQDDGTERDADWDNDGSNNITELKNGSDPRESSTSNETPPDDSQPPAPEESEGETPPDDQLPPEGDAYEDSNEEVGEGETQPPPPPTDTKTLVKDSAEVETYLEGQEMTDAIKEAAKAVSTALKNPAVTNAAQLAEAAGNGALTILTSTGKNFRVRVVLKYHEEINGVRGADHEITVEASVDGSNDAGDTFSFRLLHEEGGMQNLNNAIEQAKNKSEIEFNAAKQAFEAGN